MSRRLPLYLPSGDTSMKLDTRNAYAARMLRVLKHMRRNLDEPLELEALSALAHVSISHFHRVFRGMLGETIMDHLRRIRLEKAAAQLTTSRASVTDIALGAGYDSLEAFSRVFRKCFGLSPSQCRKQLGQLRFLPAPSGVHYCSGELMEFLFDETGAAIMNVRIETLPERSILRVRQVGPYPESGKRAWKILCDWGVPKGLFAPATIALGIGHDAPTITARKSCAMTRHSSSMGPCRRSRAHRDGYAARRRVRHRHPQGAI